jgi:hypothetical protein
MASKGCHVWKNTIDWKVERSVKQRRKRVNVTTCTASAHSFFDTVLWNVELSKDSTQDLIFLLVITKALFLKRKR